ncbi:hypothetical protein BGZ58_001034 [Dissophora ornata]|nr:hypothetical protein BGZ58_001034 [Dissophora ornata]
MVRWGMVGWAVAFASRTPVYAFFEKTLYMSEYSCEWSTLLSAGVVEEITRLGIIKFLGIGDDFGAVYWLGLGWAGIETLYYIGQSLIYSRWLLDEDYRTVTNIPLVTAVTEAAVITTNRTIHAEGVEEGVKDLEEIHGAGDDIVHTHQARHLLGIDRPWWSLMGRTSSMMVHIGFCCWLGYSGWKLLFPAALVHGTLYIVWGVLMPKHWSVPATSYGTLMAAMTVFLIGLALYGEIV